MPNVYVEPSDLEISRDDVFESTDVEELTEWLEEQQGVSQEIAIMLGAMKLAPDANTVGLARKLGFVNISIAWIQSRLSELGVTDDRVVPRKDRKMKAHLDTMAKSLQDRNATIKAQNIELTALRQELARYRRAEVKAA